jgi:formate dehydrogenase subunit gamma
VVLCATAPAFAEGSQLIQGFAPEPSTAAYHALNEQLTGDWQQYGEVFTNFAASLFNRLYLLLLVGIPAAFLVHYLVVGAKHFDHDGPRVKYFGIISRSVHWGAALSFSLLVVTGIMTLFGKFLGGGLVMMGRNVHVVAALVFAAFGLLMFLIWFIDMLPAWYDIMWLFILGGYLSKQKKPVPAGRFNAGQKMWFWCATVGGGVMAYSGYQLFFFELATDQLRVWVMVHIFLGMILVAFFLTHLYMSLFAIDGSIHSMINGHKPQEEVAILHSRYKVKKNPL